MSLLCLIIAHLKLDVSLPPEHCCWSSLLARWEAAFSTTIRASQSSHTLGAHNLEGRRSEKLEASRASASSVKRRATTGAGGCTTRP
mmetsp:Transcript_40813/g.87639  ORF Transcript_40813/g.87639 Transcript_40813/m.87639 type:complete len:87 (-) Transcript_40813:550-810(-)